MNISRRHILVLLPAAAVAWKFVHAGTPEDSPNYQMSEHWWGMLIDIPKCIGCGNCVRACQTENDVPDGFFRTWVERYNVSDENMTSPTVISPDGGKEGFPLPRKMARNTSLFRRCATIARIRPARRYVGWRDVRQSRRRGAD